MPQPDYVTFMQRARQLQSEEVARVMGLAARALKHFVVGLAAHARARSARRRAAAALLTMDSRSLSDLGLTRAYVSFAAEHGREIAPAPANGNSVPDRASSAA